MPDNNIEATLLETNEIEATLVPSQGIRAETDTIYLYNPDAVSISHDDSLKGAGSSSNPLGISDDVMAKIERAANTYIFDFDASQTTWLITHNLGKRPSVDVVDSAGSVVEPMVRYVDDNSLEIELNAAFNGTAYLN